MIQTESCIGCQACVEMCPAHAITLCRDSWGEGRAAVDAGKCIGCGLCDRICPAAHAEFYSVAKTVNAVVSIKHRKTGSSGGVFYEIASAFIESGGVVYGAAFDENLKLLHRRAANPDELMPLCKSKYLHSDMTGVYSSICSDLNAGVKVLFVGTPCQVSAVKNLFSRRYDDLLYLADFLCRGTGTQRVFDACIREEEKKRGGKITAFCFRAKVRKAEHSFSYTLDQGGIQKVISGYAFEFPYYHSFLKYTIFNDACYGCTYAQNARVGDITLGDFWGIQRCDPSLRDWEGVSMLAVHSKKGEQLFSMIKPACTAHSYDLHTAASRNQSFHTPLPYPERKTELAEILKNGGEAALADALTCPDIKKNLLWARTPNIIKRAYRKLRRK